MLDEMNRKMKSIKPRITLILLACLTGAVIIFFVVIGAIFNRNHRINQAILQHELLNQETDLLEITAKMFFRLVNSQFIDGSSKEEVLEYILNIDQLDRSVVVFDSRGKSVLEEHSDPELLQLVSKQFLSKQMEKWRTKNIKDFAVDNYIAFQQSPVRVAPKKIFFQVFNSQELVIGYGKVLTEIRDRLISIERRNFENRSKLLTVTIFVVLGGMFLVIGSTLLFMRRKIFKPLELLIEHFGLVSQGELSHRVRVKTEDEIGKLTRAYNEMTANLSLLMEEKREANIQLDLYSKELESRVEKRTHELFEVVEQLKREISERKYIQDVLYLMEIAIEQSIDGIAIANPDLTSRIVNESWARMHGGTVEFFTGKNIAIFHSEKQYREEVLPFIEKVALQGSVQGEVGHVRLNGETFPTWMSVTQLKDETGKTIAVLGIARDITEIKRTENELRAAKAEAISASIAKSQFLANMSHEIRTPMNAIIGMSELILDTKLTPEQEDYLKIVKNSAESLLGLLNDILDLSKIEVGKLEVEPIEFHLRESLSEIANSLSVQVQRKQIELIYDIDMGIPNVLIGDPGRLRQVLTNLMGNGVKFTEKGMVVLRIKVESPSVISIEELQEITLHFTISDTGIGIPIEKQGQIFDKFFQTDSSITRRFGGTGLGLAISNQLIQLMGGKIRMQSPGELGEVIPGNPGSTFDFDLTFKIPTNCTDFGVYTHISQLNGLSVLIVDDNAINRKIYHEMLKRWGLIPTLAEDGLKALELLKQAAVENRQFHLAIIDYQMPVMDGFELVSRIREEEMLRDLQIIILTSMGFKGDGKTCRDLGIAAYLRKPVPSTELLDTLLIIIGNVGHEKKISPLITHHVLQENRQSIQILVAEDNLINQKLIKRILEKNGYHVQIANNGTETVRKIEENHFDIVLMDIQMPEMDGVEATRVIREKEKCKGAVEIPIIALTAHAMKGDRERFMEAGMNSYVSKPIKQSELLGVIEKFTLPGENN